MSLSIKTKELLCDQFEFPNCPDAKRLQRRLALELAHAFEVGGEKDAATDLWKANRYREKAGLKPLDAGSDIFRTENFYWLAGLYTGGRLNTLRVNQLTEALGHAFLHRLFSIAGFSYLLEIPFHTGVIIYSTFFKPVTEAEKKIDPKELIKLRFKNVLTKDERLPRLINALLWGPLNLAAFLIAGPIAIALNIIGFTIDFALAITFTVQKIRQMETAIQEVNQEIHDKQAELAALETAKAKGENVDEKRINNLRHDINGLQHMQLSLKDSCKEAKEQSVYGLLFTGVILAGIVMSFFPPTMILGAVLTAVTMVFAIPEMTQSIVSLVKGVGNFAVKAANKFFELFKPKPVVKLDHQLDLLDQPLLARQQNAALDSGATLDNGSYQSLFSKFGKPENEVPIVNPLTVSEVSTSTLTQEVKENTKANNGATLTLFKNPSAITSQTKSTGKMEDEPSLDETWAPTSFSLPTQTVY